MKISILKKKLKTLLHICLFRFAHLFVCSDYSRCQETCDDVRYGNFHELAGDDMCGEIACGCVCPADKVLSDDGQSCVPRSQCPCKDNEGNLFQIGEFLTRFLIFN